MALLSPTLLGFSFIASVAISITRLLRSPLSRLPGPSISRFSSLALKWHEFKGHRTEYIHSLHKQYGSIVRLTPDEVSFTSQAAVKEIYGSGGSGYDKTEFYDLFKVFRRRTMFTTLDKHNHAMRKRIIADRYANTNIQRPESIGGIVGRSEALVKKCQESVGSSIDLYVGGYTMMKTESSLHSYAFDCVTHHLFHPYGSHALEKEFDEDVMREITFDDSLQNRLIEYYYPTIHRLLNKAVSLIAKPRETPLADEFIEIACSQTDASRFTLLSRLLERGEGLDSTDIEAECLDHMAAGIDTTGDALCFLMWELSQPRSFHFQKRLQDEFAANPDAPVGSLKFLDAVIHEGLRCFPAIPMSLPRRVPRDGRVIDGFFLPEKTIVSCQAYSVGRMDTSVFPEPDVLNPDRWLAEKGEAERKRLFFAFSSGGRGCVGKHLALTEMQHALKGIYSRFTTLPEETMTEEMMEMAHQPISSRPKGQKVLMKMVPMAEGTGPV